MSPRAKTKVTVGYALAGVQLFKVLGPEGQAFHGGNGAWSLPTDSQPGEWMRVNGALVLCKRGLHLTDKPLQWWKPDARIFQVEIEDGAAFVGSLDDGDHKIAVSAARLVKETDWADHCVWLDGEHSLSQGEARASGSATVWASGSATVRAYGSATVRAYGSATVWAYDSATVEAYDSATVWAYGSATVWAYDSANVISSVYHSASAQVALSGMAAHIDRRESKIELRKASA